MKTKNVIGPLVMAAAIVVSVPLGVNRSFSRLREDVEGQYYFDMTGYAIWEGIDKRMDAANNLLTVAEKYVEQDPELDVYMDSLERAITQCEDTYFYDIEDVGETVRYNARMGEAAQNLADRLETLELSEKDAKYPRQLISEMESEQDKIERSSFNDAVLEYNRQREKFPASVLAPISGVKEIVPFDAGSGGSDGGSASPAEEK